MPWEHAPVRLVTALASAARTTAGSPHNSDTIETRGRQGCYLFVDVTLDPDTVSITVKLQGYDEATGTWFDITGADTGAINAVGHSFILVHPSIQETANVSISTILPGKIRVVSTHTGGTTMTYGVYLELLP